MDPFWIQVALSFVVGGCWIAATATIAELQGSTVGGLLGGLPSTLVVALLFIGWTQGVDATHATTTALPVAFAANALFMLGYAAVARHGLPAGLAAATGLWLATQGSLVGLGAPSYPVALALWLVALVGTYMLMDRLLQLPTAQATRPALTPGRLAMRAVLAGMVISLAVILTRWGGAVLGAVMAAFPAVYLSSLVITARSSGIAFSRALTLPLMLSGVFNCVIYATVFRLTVHGLGLLGATGVAYVAALASAMLVLLVLRQRAANQVELT